MRYVPFRPARLQVRTRNMARGTRRYVRESLAIAPVEVPWHRGFVALGNIAGAMALGAWSSHPSSRRSVCSVP